LLCDGGKRLQALAGICQWTETMKATSKVYDLTPCIRRAAIRTEKMSCLDEGWTAEGILLRLRVRTRKRNRSALGGAEAGRPRVDLGGKVTEDARSDRF
jgi:hypothetical protein